MVRDNSVAAQFMQLDGKGNSGAWRVQLGDGSTQAKERELARAKIIASRQDTYNPAWKPLGNAVWKTSFQVDQNGATGWGDESPSASSSPATQPAK
ncbi:MAG: hypothetical protein FWD61_06080 [Phycisphaerales bacterium]|nr:hypothetical protein [Phycisphaerales bacterium]